MVRAAERACINPRDLNHEFDNAADAIFNTPIAAMAEAIMRLMQLPQNPETERIIMLTRNAVEQLEQQNLLSSIHGVPSRATALIAPQASRTPGGHPINEKSGHTLECARTCSKIVKTINTSSLPTPTG